MDIVTRLKQFLKQTGIANSQFADTCEIPRPTLSQLLNGRNKKVSDEVITKIHRAYPSLNIMWLMFGDGEMFASEAAGEEALSAQQPVSMSPSHESVRSISFDSADSDFDSRRQSGTLAVGKSSAGRSAMPPAGVQPASFSEAIENLARSAVAGSRQSANRGTASSEGRRVVSVMVFYNDGRFDTFTP